jgi:CxxC-x17-CxxC domain-containing protein
MGAFATFEFLIRQWRAGQRDVRPRTALYENKRLICKDCGNAFDFSVRDQMFYAEKGFENEPQRCRDCRNVRKTQRGAAGAPASSSGAREMFDAVCAQCGENTTVPFRPRGDRPVYCRSCYSAQNAVRA